MASVQRLFLSAPQFAVVGASTNKEKFGTKVLRWYIDRSKEVTPVHPKEPELEGLKTVKALAALPDPAHTSVSVITPPAVTLGVLREAKALGVPALWIQPGAEDAAVRSYIEEAGLTDRVVLGGPCVLVLGDGILAGLETEKKANL
ncbi:NAD(P)-binding protein [Exidia glandulosa HHB12029]|uniref:NAD(P)-binding protein n=1 Tax=Exidia glandulosa HHB12029 TaxID=1314781 RepID=A0A165P9A5_EXIGL|nr:NAD(P)-binding protein [Exidia glandulosa HHB12029]